MIRVCKMEEQLQFSFMEETNSVCSLIGKCYTGYGKTEEERDNLCRTPKHEVCALTEVFARALDLIAGKAELEMMAKLGIEYRSNQYLGFIHF